MIGCWVSKRNRRIQLVVCGDWNLFLRRCVFEITRTLRPSQRGELEITDVNNAYIASGALTWNVLDGWWTDAGTIESLLAANQLVAQTGANRMEL